MKKEKTDLIQIINLTPYDAEFKNYFVFDFEGVPQYAELIIKPCGKIASVSTIRKKIGNIGGISVYKTYFSKIENLPEPQKETIYIVSRIVSVASRLQGRTDCYFLEYSADKDECQGLGISY